MDYLGIGVTSPPNSEMGEPDIRGDTTDQNLTTQMGTRTWSKPSISETMSQSFPRPSRAVQSPIQSGRGIVVSQAILKIFSVRCNLAQAVVITLYAIGQDFHWNLMSLYIDNQLAED